MYLLTQNQKFCHETNFLPSEKQTLVNCGIVWKEKWLIDFILPSTGDLFFLSTPSDFIEGYCTFQISTSFRTHPIYYNPP